MRLLPLLLIVGCSTTTTTIRHQGCNEPTWDADITRQGCGWSESPLPRHEVEDSVILDDGTYMYYQCDTSPSAPCVWADVPELELNGALYWWDGKNRQEFKHEYILDLWWVCKK